MRIAIVSDIHGNLTALEAVLADLKFTSPDLILHGGDLADSGSSPGAIVDLIRSFGWQGVVGNTDEMLTKPAMFEEFAGQRPALDDVWAAVRQMSAFTRDQLGEDRLSWLRTLPRMQVESDVAFVHASPESPWRSPLAGADEAEFLTAYKQVARRVVVYGHIHTAFVRPLSSSDHPVRLIANTGSVGLPYDCDQRAAYLLLEDSIPIIRRVEYDVERESQMLSDSGLPHWDWVAKIIRSIRGSSSRVRFPFTVRGN